MAISHFADLLDEARRQPEPQRLLFVCTRAELPDHPSEEQRRRFVLQSLLQARGLDRQLGEIAGGVASEVALVDCAQFGIEQLQPPVVQRAA